MLTSTKNWKVTHKPVGRIAGIYATGFFSETDFTVLLDKWNPAWGDLVVFPGGVRTITLETIKNAPIEQTRKVYGKKFADQMLQVAVHNSPRP